MPDEPQLEVSSQPVPSPSPEPHVESKREYRKLGDEEFKAKLEMTKAFCDTAKSYVQISSAGLDGAGFSSSLKFQSSWGTSSLTG